jgi:hypothetical protein
MKKGINFYREPQLDRPCLIAAWAGMGNLALGAARFLRERVQEEVFAEIAAADFSPYPALLPEIIWWVSLGCPRADPIGDDVE